MVLIDLLNGLVSGFRTPQSCDIDSAIFKLHYRITAAFLFTFCILITAKGLVGDPINCVHGDSARLTDEVVNTYCWIHTTFTLPRHLHKETGKDTGILHPGVGTDVDGDDRIYHSYYQWVPFVLFLQGLIFYIPHWLWKIWEGGKVNSMVLGLSNPLMNPGEKQEKILLLADYIHTTLHHHEAYAFKFFLCEILNLINALGNFFFLDAFLGGMFLSFGVKVTNYLQVHEDQRTDPLIVLFPRVTKCTFLMYGYSGTIEKLDFMCVLALNILNEKIYIFLWFWFVLLTIISGLSVVFRLLVMLVTPIRIGLLQKRVRLINSEIFYKVISKNLTVGDAFLLQLLSKNIDVLAFSAVMEDLYRRFETQRSYKDSLIKPESHSLMSERV